MAAASLIPTNPSLADIFSGLHILPSSSLQATKRPIDGDFFCILPEGTRADSIDSVRVKLKALDLTLILRQEGNLPIVQVTERGEIHNFYARRSLLIFHFWKASDLEEKKEALQKLADKIGLPGFKAETLSEDLDTFNALVQEINEREKHLGKRKFSASGTEAEYEDGLDEADTKSEAPQSAAGGPLKPGARSPLIKILTDLEGWHSVSEGKPERLFYVIPPSLSFSQVRNFFQQLQLLIAHSKLNIKAQTAGTSTRTNPKLERRLLLIKFPSGIQKQEAPSVWQGFVKAALGLDLEVEKIKPDDALFNQVMQEINNRDRRKRSRTELTSSMGDEALYSSHSSAAPSGGAAGGGGIAAPIYENEEEEDTHSQDDRDSYSPRASAIASPAAREGESSTALVLAPLHNTSASQEKSSSTAVTSSAISPRPFAQIYRDLDEILDALRTRTHSLSKPTASTP